MRKFITTEQKQTIINLYEKGNSAYKIAKELSIDNSSVYYQLKKYGIKSKLPSEAGRKYSLNQNYFEKIDTEDKAYFLGLLASDGCITDTNKILIGLQEEDGYILELFKKYVDYEGVLFKIDRKNDKWKNQIRLQMRSIKMTSDLYKLNIIPRKSLILELPIIEEKMYPHFIRGYFDGDGCVKFNKGVLHLRFVGTFEFLNSIQNIFIKNCNVSEVKMYQAKKDKNTYELSYGGDKQCIRIYNYLYDNSSIFLNRKKEKISNHITKRLELYSSPLLEEELRKRNFIPHFQS